MYDYKQIAVNRKNIRHGAIDDSVSIPAGGLRKCKKRFGIKYSGTYSLTNEVYHFTRWYKSKRDRAQALLGVSKSGYSRDESIELVER